MLCARRVQCRGGQRGLAAGIKRGAAQGGGASWKVTVPVGVPTPALTVAVKVTACPYVEGLAPLLSAVELAARLPGLNVPIWLAVVLSR